MLRVCTVVLQVLLQSHSHHGYNVIHTSAIAAGGRYDSLLRSLWSPAAAALMPAPGAGGVV
jgi:histidyl-tRNA synthetase